MWLILLYVGIGGLAWAVFQNFAAFVAIMLIGVLCWLENILYNIKKALPYVILCSQELTRISGEAGNQEDDDEEDDKIVYVRKRKKQASK